MGVAFVKTNNFNGGVRKPYLIKEEDGQLSMPEIEIPQKDDLPKLEFIGISRGKFEKEFGDSTKCDVMIYIGSEHGTVDKSGENRRQIYIRFFNGAYDKAFKIDRLKFAGYGSKLYFSPDVSGGYKFSKMGENDSCQSKWASITSGTRAGKLVVDYKGSYKMEYDDRMDLYFIDQAHKIGA